MGGAGIATAPHAAAGQLLRATLTELPVDALYDAEWWRALPAVTDVLGPAVLAYLDRGLDEITSPAFLVREGTRVVAAAGYRRWPGEVAHLCVLAAPGSRGRGLARTVATAATGDALAAGLLPHWRARTEASRRVARALGYRELGRQLSAHIGRRAAAQAT
ncbi:GNAT family N-acetyltransferase [Micromonospora sp. RTP1Z1]|uniref:GNAT family N-acetyltransferase n=1 Tax=Micromonospora sp. RTP1Z1 TaxID=2994043 RepID=UPI0029C692F6|nr:GNAT family N-acetyltransferase [Micromonospora sp. RTP1Z1]